MEREFTLPAFAKINLGLRVLGRRADGYHEIRTVFQTITLRDELRFAPLPDGRLELTCTSLDVPTDESNLVFKAAEALRERFGVEAGARVALAKIIPAGGGLGGGSSDAATALIGLSHLWELEASRGELCELGARLGADVPFFFTGGTALGTGTGTTIEPLEDAPHLTLLVVAPEVRVSTPAAYSSLNAPALTSELLAASLSVSRVESQNAYSQHEGMSNDFEAVIFRLHPEIGRAREALAGAGARSAHLSGSGACLFGIFDTEGDAARARRSLEGDGGWRLFQCATLSRAEYVRAFERCAAIFG